MTPQSIYRTDVAIVGAGLSGLALATRLKSEGRKLIVLEARDRTGGRILTKDGYDLGPAWIWPHNQRLLSLVDQLGLNTFRQHSAGRLVFEDQHGQVRRDIDMATMGDALRIEGGLGKLTTALADQLTSELKLNHPVQRIVEQPSGVKLEGDEFTVHADVAVLALPPRLATALGVSIPDSPTWMAGHAKFVAIYATPFWRELGLNGDAISHVGPLMEIHDASPMQANQSALFGFTVPGAARAAGFETAALDQLKRLFGPEAAKPQSVLIKDWSEDPQTATSADRAPPSAHPIYRPVPPRGRLVFCSTEVALENGGFLEGALEAAETALEHLQRVDA